MSCEYLHNCQHHTVDDSVMSMATAAVIHFCRKVSSAMHHKNPECNADELMMRQVLSFLDIVTASSLLRLVRAHTTTQAPVKGRKQENTGADDIEVDGDDHTAPSTSSAATIASLATQECAIIISNLADLFQQFGARDQPDIVRTTIETLTQVTRLCTGKPHSRCCMHLVLDSLLCKALAQKTLISCW